MTEGRANQPSVSERLYQRREDLEKELARVNADLEKELARVNEAIDAIEANQKQVK
jgi:hypothetical protein